ncbi:hypothetical protein KAH55_07660 [bacterium]|nr:hypothetical protein [bacterium]
MEHDERTQILAAQQGNRPFLTNSISGTLQNPDIQTMLSRAMTVAMNPAVSLHAN